LTERLSSCSAAEKALGNLEESVTAEAGMQESGQLDELGIALASALLTAPVPS
jgi:hypothetical protein